MGLDFNLSVLLTLFNIIVFVYAVYKKYWRLTGVMLILIIISMMFNPINLTQSNISVYEATQNRFDDIPERVQVIDQSFNDHQNKNLNQLKKESHNEKP